MVAESGVADLHAQLGPRELALLERDLALRGHVLSGLAVEVDRPQLTQRIARLTARAEQRVADPERERPFGVVAAQEEALVVSRARAGNVLRALELVVGHG